MIGQTGNRAVEAQRLVLLGVNEKGRLVGEDHPRATLSNADVDLVLELLDQGLSWRKVGRIMDCSKTQVGRIAKGDQRAQRATRFVSRKVKL